MTTDPLTFTQGDTSPALTGKTNVNLAGISAIAAHIKRPDETVLTKTATVTDAATGAWAVAWDAGDLAQAGWHYVEVQVTFSDNRIQTFALDTQGVANNFLVRRQYA